MELLPGVPGARRQVAVALPYSCVYSWSFSLFYQEQEWPHLGTLAGWSFLFTDLPIYSDFSCFGLKALGACYYSLMTLNCVFHMTSHMSYKFFLPSI